MTAPPRCHQVADGVWRAAVPLPSSLSSVNAYLVDTAFVPGRSWEHIPQLMRAAAAGPEQLRGLVLTHTHLDHVGHIRAVEDQFGLPGHLHPDEELTSVWAAPQNRDLFQAWLAEQGVDTATAARLLTVLDRGPEPLPRHAQRVAHGQLLRIGATVWTVLHTPGHTPGHVCLFRESDGTLLTGDHLLPNDSPNISVRPGQPYNPLGRYLAALRMIGELPVRLALPGHGEPISDIAALLGRRLDHHEQRLADVSALAGCGARSAFQVALGIKWVHRTKHFSELDTRHQFLALGETLAHLVALEASGTLKRTRQANTTLWTHH